jgi:beta-1,4-mannosyltransferase
MAERIRVGFVPIWDRNPYHGRLREALAGCGVDVVETDRLKAHHEEPGAAGTNVDVLHIHAIPNLGLEPRNIARYALFHARLAGLQKRGVAMVRTIHDLYNHDAKFWRLEMRANRHLAHRLDALIVHGESARTEVEDAWGLRGSDRIHVIPHGNYIGAYPNDVSRERARKSLGLDPERLVFLFLGFIRPYKGVVEMVDAFRTWAEPSAQLLIAGMPSSDAMREEVTQAIRGDARIVFFPEHVEDSSVQLYMNACDVVVLPHRRVFTSGAAVLAMSFGKPCIAPTSAGVAEMLGPSGALYFDPEKPDDLQRAFEEAHVQAARLGEMGARNHARAAEWTWESVAERTAAVYRMARANRR